LPLFGDTGAARLHAASSQLDTKTTLVAKRAGSRRQFSQREGGLGAEIVGQTLLDQLPPEPSSGLDWVEAQAGFHATPSRPAGHWRPWSRAS